MDNTTPTALISHYPIVGVLFLPFRSEDDYNDLQLSQAAGGISLQSLPKSFGDAIQITKSISGRYLWIGSLLLK